MTADQGIDLTGARLGVEINAIGVKGALVLSAAACCIGLLFRGAARRAALGFARTFGKTVRDVINGVKARHILRLKEMRRMGLALGKKRDQDISTGYFFTP